MKKSFAAACGGLLIVALAAGCGTQAPSAGRSPARSAASSPSVSRPAYRRAGRHHAATGRPGSGRFQGCVCHVCLDP